MLNTKPIDIVEVITLATAIFWDFNFYLCLRHTLNLVKKLGLKTKSFKVDIVKERIRQVLVNKIITELDMLFNNNLE